MEKLFNDGHLCLGFLLCFLLSLVRDQVGGIFSSVYDIERHLKFLQNINLLIRTIKICQIEFLSKAIDF